MKINETRMIRMNLSLMTLIIETKREEKNVVDILYSNECCTLRDISLLQIGILLYSREMITMQQIVI